MNAPRFCTLAMVQWCKTPQLLHFTIAKGGTKIIAHLPIAEGFTTVNCGMKKDI
jgi:hypothetical protein